MTRYFKDHDVRSKIILAIVIQQKQGSILIYIYHGLGDYSRIYMVLQRIAKKHNGINMTLS